MAQLPQEQKAKIAEQVASFQEEKSKLDAEVSKWDDSGNDIIVLAKQMCMIMMEMTDFTRCSYNVAKENLVEVTGSTYECQCNNYNDIDLLERVSPFKSTGLLCCGPVAIWK
jgi:hypothetical protein